MEVVGGGLLGVVLFRGGVCVVVVVVVVVASRIPVDHEQRFHDRAWFEIPSTAQRVRAAEHALHCRREEPSPDSETPHWLTSNGKRTKRRRGATSHN